VDFIGLKAISHQKTIAAGKKYLIGVQAGFETTYKKKNLANCKVF